MFNLIQIIEILGSFGVAVVIFAESGLFFGFFFPGDSLLFTAGLLASQGYLSIITLVLFSFLGAVLGDSVGYAFGRRVGPKIFTRSKSFWLRPEYVERAHIFFETYGGRAIVLARFLPVVRTFVPIVAGVCAMPYRRFVTYNILGGGLWTIGISFLGYFLGKTVPGIDHYLLLIIVFIIIVSILPTVLRGWHTKKKQ